VELTSSRWASTPPGTASVVPHSPDVAAQPIAAAMEQADPGVASVAHGATLDAAIGETTPGSTLHEGTSEEDAGDQGSEGTEGSE
jgi:hypothetical protein